LKSKVTEREKKEPKKWPHKGIFDLPKKKPADSRNRKKKGRAREIALLGNWEKRGVVEKPLGTQNTIGFFKRGTKKTGGLLSSR